jgi:hypothetical protein
MKFRKLRIAWSAVCGVLCLLLIVLWVRSYPQIDTLDNLYGYRIDVKQGKLVLGERVQPPIGSIPKTLPLTAAVTQFLVAIAPTRVVVVASIPLWILVVIGSSLTPAPWIRHLKWRFSLRTLLIGMTVVAVALGLIFALSQ